MKKWIFLVAVLIACILEETVLNYLRIFGVKPNLLLAGVILASLVFESNWAITFSFFLGFLRDTFNFYAFGFNAVAFALWSILITQLSKKIKIDNNLIRLALVFIVAVLNVVFTKVVFVYLGRPVALGIFFRIASVEVIYTSLISLFIFRVFRSVLQQ